MTLSDPLDPQTMWLVRREIRFSDLHRGWLEVHQTFEVSAIRRVPR